MTTPPSVEVLLEDATWLRALTRGLVRDTVHADDAAQEVWLSLLRDGVAPRAGLRAWLAGAARHAVSRSRRAEARRRTREQAVARPEGTPSTADVVEAFSTRLTVAEAVHELGEPFRETILLRYYEELSLKEIAARTGVSVPTASARVQRGLERLRWALERRFGASHGSGREARGWIGALRPLFEREVPARVPGLMAGLSLAAVATIVGVFFWTSHVSDATRSTGLAPAPRAEPEPELAADPLRHEADSRTLASDELVAARDTEARTRTKADSFESGSLRVRVLQSDGVPAIDLPVEARRGDALDPASPVLIQRTGALGELDLTDLEPGEWVLETPLGCETPVRVLAGRRTRTELRLAPGPALSGVVVDAVGQPVPHAGVWLSDRAAQVVTRDRLVRSVIPDEFITRADGHGAFRLETVGAARSIGARADGYAPSPATTLSKLGARELELRLVLGGPGGALSGVVCSPDGEPIAGATVTLDPGSREVALPDGRRFERVLPWLRTRTDALGRFLLRGLGPGARQLFVRAPDMAPWRAAVDLHAGTESSLVVALSRGAEVTGTVLDEQGTPLAGVLVWAASRPWSAPPDPLHALGVRSASDGSYRLRGIDAGPCWIGADGGAWGRASTAIVLGADGSETVHDVVLSAGCRLFGRVLDGEGRGLAGLIVGARPCSGWRVATTSTGEGGAFELTGLASEAHKLFVREGATALVRDLRVQPGPDEVRVRIDDALRPTASITGRVTSAEGGVLLPTGVRLVQAGGDRELELEPEPGVTDGFHVDGVPPGTWSVGFIFEDHPPHTLEDPQTFAPHQILNLGDLRLAPAGRLELDFIPPPGGFLFDLRVRVHEASGTLVHDLRVPDADARLPLSLAVRAGAIELRASAAGYAPIRRDMRIEARTTRRVALPFEPGVACRLRFTTPAGTAPPASIDIRVFDADSVLVLEGRLRAPIQDEGTDSVETIDLLPGPYTIQAHAMGLSASGDLEVHEGMPPILLPLAPR